jgi:hypothetical protein
MRVGTLNVPEGWQVSSRMSWDFSSANYPARMHVRAQSPDGRIWLELLPYDVVYWLRPVYQPIPLGQRAYGAVYAPNATIEQAMEHLVVRPARAKLPGFAITGRRPVDARRMAAAFGSPELHGEAMAMRVRYTLNGRPAEEDFYGLYMATRTIPYDGPQGHSEEYHRPLVLAHSVGATDGLLPSVYPLLGTSVSSFRADPEFLRHRDAVSQQITAQYNAALRRGYDSIAAAGQLSRQISANNDAMLASSRQRRAAQQQADTQRRAAAAANSEAMNSNDQFSQYIRGTTRMSDPYWGTSDRDSNYSHHWTDGQGNYRASNDPSFDPNVGAGSGPNWQRMTPGR